MARYVFISTFGLFLMAFVYRRTSTSLILPNPDSPGERSLPTLKPLMSSVDLRIMNLCRAIRYLRARCHRRVGIPGTRSCWRVYDSSRMYWSLRLSRSTIRLMSSNFTNYHLPKTATLYIYTYHSFLLRTRTLSSHLYHGIIIIIIIITCRHG